MKAKSPPKSDGKRGKPRTSKIHIRKPAKTIRSNASIPIPAADLLERVSDGFVAFDAGMTYTYVNQKGGELLGRNPEDLIGKNYWVEYPEAKGSVFAKAYVRALETQETIVLEDYYEPFDRWFENRIYPSRDGLTIFFTDITERKKAELALREMQERLALAIHSANIGLWDWDLQTDKVRYSREWKSQLGYEEHEISNDFSEWESRVHSDDLERAKATVSSYIEKPYPNFQNEFRMLHKDGSYRWILAQASLLMNERGKPIRMLGSHIDITERKRTEEGLRRWETIFKHAGWGVVTSEPTANTITMVNPALAKMYGYAESEMIGMPLADLFAPETLGELPTHIRLAAEKGYHTHETLHRRKDGATFPVQVDVAAFKDRDGNVLYRAANIRDITERKAAEERLRLSEEKFYKVFHSSPDIIVLTSMADGRLVEVNETLERNTGYTHAEIVGRTTAELQFWADPAERDRYVELLRRDGRVRDLEVKFRIKSGEVRDALLSGEIIELQDGRYILGVIRDITERKRAEEKLRESEARFSTIFHASPIGINLFRISDGCSVNANDAFLELIGYPREELIGHSAAEFDLFVDTEARRAWLETLRSTGKVRGVDAQLRRKSGEIRDALASIDIIEIGGERMGLVIAADITERKRSQQALQRNEQTLRLFVEYSPAAIAMFDKEMRYIVASRRYAVDYELGVQNLVGRSHYEVFPEIPERWKEIHRRCLAGAVERAEEDPFPRRDGRTDWIRWEIRPWHEADGEIGGVVLFSEVITERKQARDELRLSRDRLAQLSRRLVEVHETERRAIGRELHDQIGQMLTALKLTIEVAVQLPPEQALQKAAQGKALLDDLMSRVSRLSLELRPPMLDDLGLVPALLWHVNRYQEQAGIEVEFSHSGLEGKRFDPEIETTVYRTVQEALTNAARHAQGTRVRLEVRVESGWMNIQVEDNGVGFDPQAALALNRGLGGMRERVNLLGGSFEIESQPGKGAKKFIQLPLREETQ